MSAKNEKTLREMLAEFDEIVASFDDENLDVDEAISRYENGAELAKKIREKLENEKNKLEIVSRKFGENDDEKFAKKGENVQ